MNILFVTFGELSLTGGAQRSVSMLCALADAGHQVDVAACRADLPEHPNIHMLERSRGRDIPCRKLRSAVRRAVRKTAYDAVHAVDDAALFVSRIPRLRRRRLIYDAVRCFSGSHGCPPSRLWKLAPKRLARREIRLLQRADAVFCPCPTLKGDLQAVAPSALTVQIEDVPAQALYCGRETEPAELLSAHFEGRVSTIVVCSALPEERKALKILLVGVRKVIESVPEAVFFFKGGQREEAERLAANLDILPHCAFLRPDETPAFLTALDIADAALLVPPAAGRYMHADVFTLLNSPAPVVAVQDPAYESILTDRNCIPVLPGSTGIAEGLLRAIREPLFSIGIGEEGQQLVADRFSHSTFKHKVRMAYHEIFSG